MKNTCDSCKEALRAHNSIHLKIGDDYQHLCLNCYNEVMSEHHHDINFENVGFDPINLSDKDGAEHTFTFHTRLLGDQVAMEAFEEMEGDKAGYQFQVIGRTKDDILSLYQSLYEKMKRALNQKHIEPNELTSWPEYSITRNDIVRGHITSDINDGSTPVVIIDGHEISWDEFGKMVATYMGFNFKMELFDQSEEK